MKISLIAAMAKNRVIGNSGQMPWHLPADLKHFKAVTLNKPIIMGRKTFESIGRALPGRRNIVVTRDKTFTAPDIEVAHDLPSALMLADNVPEVMIIGGGELYRQALPVAHMLYLTFIDVEALGDTLFPDFDRHEWQEISTASYASDSENPYAYQFVVFTRKFS